MIFSRLALLSAALAFGTPQAALGVGNDQPVRLQVELSQSVIATTQKNRVFIRIVLESLRHEHHPDRAPLNVALVIDRSGSMSGRKIAAARQAAMMAVDRLSRQDIVSVVSYDDRIGIEVPATRVGSRYSIKRAIQALSARGSTAIHAGLLAGANEIRKFKSPAYVNRIILLSDGLANVGPKHPHEFEALGRELGSEGIVVSTIGLGLKYNEDLMSKLARASDGNHAFVQEPEDLAQFFNKEFDDVEGIVAQDIEIIIECAPGVRPIGGLGRQAKVSGNRIVYHLGQIIGGREQVVLGEIEVPEGLVADDTKIAKVTLAYRATSDKRERRREQALTARGSQDTSLIRASYNKEIMQDVTLLRSRLQKAKAIKLRDAGQYDAAKRLFQENAAMISKQQLKFLPEGARRRLFEAEQRANEEAAKLSRGDRQQWNRQRKIMREQSGNTAGASLRY